SASPRGRGRPGPLTVDLAPPVLRTLRTDGVLRVQG
uniref:Uncharacterized protein n=1 Tax=Aegilops tauschii subsp. strangulata TaxID=200361 RepID=A0A453SHE1_AEGTS